MGRCSSVLSGFFSVCVCVCVCACVCVRALILLSDTVISGLCSRLMYRMVTIHVSLQHYH